MIPTTSLETSKLLKETGFRQDSYFQWEQSLVKNEEKKWVISYSKEDRIVYGKISAPTSDELLEDLPYRIIHENEDCILKVAKDKEGYLVYYVKDYYGDEMEIPAKFMNFLLPEAVAQMYLWLRKEGLI